MLWGFDNRPIRSLLIQTHGVRYKCLLNTTQYERRLIICIDTRGIRHWIQRREKKLHTFEDGIRCFVPCKGDMTDGYLALTRSVNTLAHHLRCLYRQVEYLAKRQRRHFN